LTICKSPHFNCSRYLFYSVIFSSRIVQGFGGSVAEAATISYLSVYYGDTLSEKIGVLEAVGGFGMFCGPVIGAILYGIGGISTVFLTFGSAILLLNILLYAALRENEHSDSEVDLDLEEPLLQSETNEVDALHDITHGLIEIEEEPSHIRISQLLNTKKSFVIFWTVVVILIAFDFPDSVIAIRLEEFNFSRSEIGIFYAFGLSTYIFGSLFVNKMLNHINHKNLITGALVMCFISCLIFGPSQLLPVMNESKVQLFIGLACLYFFLPFALIPIFELVIVYYTERYEYIDENSLKQALAGMYKCAYGIGEITGPLISGVLYDVFSFRVACDAISIIIICTALLFYIVIPNVDSPRKNIVLEEIGEENFENSVNMDTHQ